MIATFGPEGPKHCSGLPVCRYDADDLRRELGQDFRLDHSESTDHITLSEELQQFVYTLFRRV